MGKWTNRTTKNRWWNCVQTDINKCKTENWQEGGKKELSGERPLRRRMSALDCDTIEEEEGISRVD